MAYDASKLTKLGGLKAFAEKVKTDYATKAEVTTLSGRVDALESASGEPNVIEEIKINGVA